MARKNPGLGNEVVQARVLLVAGFEQGGLLKLRAQHMGSVTGLFVKTDSAVRADTEFLFVPDTVD